MNKNIVESVEQKRKAFTKANAAKKRVMIARDVFAQLAAKRFLATPGQWVTIGKYEAEEYTLKPKNRSAETEVCDILSGKKCMVCGIGALFVSAVEFADKLKVNELQDVYS